MKLDLSKLKLTLKVTNDKPKRVRTIQSKEIPPKKLTKLVNGRVIKQNNEYFVTVSYLEYKEHMFGNTNVSEISDKSESVIIPLTKESYNIKGVRVIFSKDSNILLIRNETQLIFGNYDPNKYIPFKDNSIVRGWIVRINGVLQFKFRNIILQNGFGYGRTNNIDDEEFQWFKDIKDGKR